MYCGLRSDNNVTLVYSLCMMVSLYKHYVSGKNTLVLDHFMAQALELRCVTQSFIYVSSTCVRECIIHHDNKHSLSHTALIACNIHCIFKIITFCNTPNQWQLSETTNIIF